MKRSEALNVIKHTALGMLEHTDRGDVDFYAEQILSDLEEAGMLPPYKYQNEPKETWSFKPYYYEWEEDET
jgi:hypothetical protein